MSVVSEALIAQNEAGTADPQKQIVPVGMRMGCHEVVSMHACPQTHHMSTNPSQYATHTKKRDQGQLLGEVTSAVTPGGKRGRGSGDSSFPFPPHHF